MEDRQRSPEEVDSLARSNKKLKDHHSDHQSEWDSTHSKPTLSTGGFGSYRDRLVGAILGAFEQAFGLSQVGEKEAEADVEKDSLCDGFVAIALSKEDKERISAPWTSSLIMKSFGRSLGYMFLSSKIRELWRPSGHTDCINLGHDFFLIKFECKEDIDKVLKRGPWFIGQQFLTIRLWEPEFKAFEASFSSVAMWIRLPELSIE